MADPADAPLPVVDPTKKPGDLADVVKAGGGARDIIQSFVSEAPTSAAALKAELETAEAAKRPAFDRAMTRLDADKLPTILTNRLDTFEMIARGWSALHAANEPAWLFRRGSGKQMVTVLHGNDGPGIEPSGCAEINGYLLRSARWCRVKETKDGEIEIPVEPPRIVAADMVAIPSVRLPPLDAIIRAPVFVKGARLVRHAGYDAESFLYYAPPPGFIEPDVPVAPTARHIEEAKTLLLERWLGDFPFESQADRTHAVALMILPLVRRMFTGPAPMHVIEAAERGTGKSKLARVLMAPSQNAFPEASTLGKEPEETRKKITSLLLAGRQVIFFDNLGGNVDSDELAAVLTAETWEDRLLGSSTPVKAPNHATWIATGNNAELSTDIARRSIRIRLNRKMERPWEWEGARIKDLEAWTLQHRRELLGAALTLVQSWVAAGLPRSTALLGSFEGWSRTLGGILLHNGLPDFLANLSAMYEQADTGLREWRSFVFRWWDEHGETMVNSPQLVNVADNYGVLASVLGAANSDRAKALRVSRALNHMRDRVLSGLKITVDIVHNQAMYRLEVVDPTLAPARNAVAPRNGPPSWGTPPPRDSDRW